MTGNLQLKPGTEDRIDTPSTQSSMSKGKPAISFACAVGLALGLLALWFSYLLSSPSLPGYLALTIILLCGMRVIFCVRSSSGGPITLTFYTFVGVWAGVGSLVQLSLDQFPWGDERLTELYGPAQLLTILALLGHSLGWTLVRDHKIIRDDRARTISRRSVALAALVMIAFAIPSLVLTGGLEGRFVSRTGFNTQLADAGIDYNAGQSVQVAFLKLFPSAIAMVLVYISIMNLRTRIKAGRWNYADISLVVLALAAVVIFANPISSTRFISLSTITAGVLALWHVRSALSRLVLTIGLLIGLIFAYPLAAWFKQGSSSTFSPELGQAAFLTVDFDGFQQTVNSLYFVGADGHSHGSYLLSSTFFWVPRSLWSSKELPASFAVSAARHYTFQNLSLPLWAEVSIEFGTIAMIFVFTLIGVLCKYLDQLYVESPTSFGAAIAVILASAEMGFVRGPTGAQTPFLGAALALTVACYWLGRQRSPRPARTRE